MNFTNYQFLNIWKKLYEVVDDRVKSNNENHESGIYKAHCKLEEIYYHSSVSNRSRIDDSVMDKYHAIHDYKEVTGEDLRTYSQTKDGFVDEKGRNALDVYKKALETTDSIPAQFKGAAFEVFSGNLKTLMGKDFASIPDMNLQIGFQMENYKIACLIQIL